MKQQRTLCVAAAIVVASLGFSAAASQDVSPGKFRLHLNQPFNPDTTRITTFLRGPFGVWGWSGLYAKSLTMPGKQELELDATHNGQNADALRVIVYVPGYRFAVIDVPALRDSRSDNVDLIPLPTRELRGRVMLPPGTDASTVQLAVGWWLSPIEDRYRLQIPQPPGSIGTGRSVGVSALDLTSTTLDRNGTFALEVPDFTKDPAVPSSAADPRGNPWSFTLSGNGRSYSMVLEGSPTALILRAK